jgi:hypothetical protein
MKQNGYKLQNVKFQKKYLYKLQCLCYSTLGFAKCKVESHKTLRKEWLNAELVEGCQDGKESDDEADFR